MPEARNTTSDIDVLLQEHRKFEPDSAFRALANVSSPDVYAKANADVEKYWAEQASKLEWSIPWKQVLDWKPPHAQWFIGGKLNASVNCVDRHIKSGRRNKAALIFEGEPGDRRTLTWASRRAIAWRSTCRSFPRRRSACSPARASARSTR
jgi:acetyl-CoA synthetase